ncbi:hypothetical protein Tco_1047913, partial [Tanacetum coccineum]
SKPKLNQARPVKKAHEPTRRLGYKFPSPHLVKGVGYIFTSLSAFLTQRTVSSIPIVFSWSDSIRPEGFLSSVLLWLVIIVAVVGVGVTVVVVVESSSVVKLSFVIT